MVICLIAFGSGDRSGISSQKGDGGPPYLVHFALSAYAGGFLHSRHAGP